MKPPKCTLLLIALFVCPLAWAQDVNSPVLKFFRAKAILMTREEEELATYKYILDLQKQGLNEDAAILKKHFEWWFNDSVLIKQNPEVFSNSQDASTLITDPMPLDQWSVLLRSKTRQDVIKMLKRPNHTWNTEDSQWTSILTGKAYTFQVEVFTYNDMTWNPTTEESEDLEVQINLDLNLVISIRSIQSNKTINFTAEYREAVEKLRAKALKN